MFQTTNQLCNIFNNSAYGHGLMESHGPSEIATLQPSSGIATASLSQSSPSDLAATKCHCKVLIVIKAVPIRCNNDKDSMIF